MKEKIAPPLAKAAGKKVSPSSMKVKSAGPVAPKKGITSTQQIVDYRKKKFGI